MYMGAIPVLPTIMTRYLTLEKQKEERVMSAKEETYLQRRIQNYIKGQGGYVTKNHGNMITEKGRADLSFTYNGLSLYWEVKTPEGYQDLLRMKKNGTLDARAQAQGIHCRLAKKARALTAIISNLDQAKLILSLLDYCDQQEYNVRDIHANMNELFEERGLDDGTAY